MSWPNQFIDTFWLSEVFLDFLETSKNDDSLETTPPKESPTETEENPIQCSPGFLVGKNGTTIELLGQDLWKKFHKLGTEMIITKAGRYV